ncbi:hypothetical protein HGRIS_002248 [Hohenbuehelia grisea]|uniref:Uncharacterized protein n=1 Tax=Hohenbuehelia grisea TaxID=104357 RepID=A0ABR3JKE1_9AGAR
MPDSNTPSTTDLEKHLQALNDLYNSIQFLRQIPMPILTPSEQIASTELRIQKQKEVSETLRSEPVQVALRAAKESEALDPSELSANPRRERRKRQRSPSPASPQPYIQPRRETTSMFSSCDEDRLPLRVDDLDRFIKEFNQSHKCKLHIWLGTLAETRHRSVFVLRFLIPDVLVAYATVNAADANSEGALVTESITVFSPMEKKPPHSQSKYAVYQTLSQQLAKMLQSDPFVSFRAVVNLLCSYDDLFTARCDRCQLVLSMEGHVPPAARVWVNGEDGVGGQWMARHVMCTKL